MRLSFLAAILIGLPIAGAAKADHANHNKVTAQRPSRPEVAFYSDLGSKANHPQRRARARSASYSPGRRKHGHKGLRRVARATSIVRKQPKYQAAKSSSGHIENAAYKYTYPEGAKAQCTDGSYSRSGSCVDHGGVFWLISRK
ncbi:MAG: hypothetical protein ABI383_03425 [Acidobacteriaceae bacterium]